MAEQTLTARWIFPVAGPPLECGTVTIAEDRIVAVEPTGRRTANVDLGDAAILPGLVNAHTHLDLSGMRGMAPPSPDFTGWLRQVIAFRRAATSEQTRADIRIGLAEVVRSGTTLIGDIASSGASWDALAAAPLRAIVFYELLGLSLVRQQAAMEAGTQWLAAHPAAETCRPGLSPHAPYSAGWDLFGWASVQCGRRRAPLAVHLAESAAEMELLRRRTGPFVPFLQDLGVWEPHELPKNPRQVVDGLNAAYRLLLVHSNFWAAPSALSRRATVVHCPRTHAAFGHPPHPFRDLLARGVRVALGTDSLASNPDLDLLAEARFVHRRYPDFPGDALLHMATLSGAEALGWQEETGSLEPGKSADFVVLPLHAENRADPHQLLFDSALPVQAVMFRGCWVHGGPAAT